MQKVEVVEEEDEEEKEEEEVEVIEVKKSPNKKGMKRRIMVSFHLNYTI